MSELQITLEAARVNAGLSQRKAAEKLNIHVATLRNYEKGRQVPNWNTVQMIGKIYNFPIENIFFGKNLALSEEDSPPAD